MSRPATSAVLVFLLGFAAHCAGGETPAKTAEGHMSNPFVYVSGYDETISCFVLDLATGTLQPASTSSGGKNPTYLAWHPSRKYMYAANEGQPGRVTAFAISPNDGALTKLNEASSAGNGPCHVSVHPSGKWVFVANYGSGTIGVLAVQPNGGVAEPQAKLEPGKNAHQIISDPSGRFVFVPCLGSNHVAQFLFDEATGELKPNNPPSVPTAQGAGPRHIVLHPAGRCAYLVNELDSTITSFAYASATGTLSDPKTQSILPGGLAVKGNSGAHVLVSPNGKFVYASNRGHDSIAIFAADPNDGQLKVVGHETGGGDIQVPRDFTLDPSGKYLLAANQKSGTVTIFRCDAEHGTLEKLNTMKVPPGPAFVGVMPQLKIE
ncbi:MAG: lactonase family protein [Planctomycetota bacterium]